MTERGAHCVHACTVVSRHVTCSLRKNARRSPTRSSGAYMLARCALRCRTRSSGRSCCWLGSTQGVLEGGVRLELVPGLHAGAQLAYEPGRKTSDSDLLQTHGVSDVDPGASVGVHIEWDHMFGPMPITLLARARQNTDAGRGAQVDLRLSAGAYRGGRVGAGVFAQTTWANARSTGSMYGVTAQQPAVTGLPVFGAGSGWLFASCVVLW